MNEKLKSQNELSKEREKVLNKADQYETPLYIASTLKPAEGGYDEARVSNMILTAVRWVVAMDYFNETKEPKYDMMAKEQRKALDDLLTNDQRENFKFLDHSIVDPYWIYEADLKKKITNGYSFSDKEVEESIMRRSSDSLLYFALASYEYPLPEEIKEVLHVRQALEDIEDCIEDFGEDLKDLEPNIFFLYMLSSSIPRTDWPSDFESARELLKQKGILTKTISYVDKIYKEAKSTPSLSKYPELGKNLDSQYESLKRDLEK